MSARMEKVRDALRPAILSQDRADAALAEVEEWEARLAGLMTCAFCAATYDWRDWGGTDRCPGCLRAEAAEAEAARWLAWSGGSYPDESPGDVIAWETDGTITLDDSITTWNPLRALKAAEAERDRLVEALRDIKYHGGRGAYQIARAALADDGGAG